MANFAENPIWEAVYQLATIDPVLGGNGGASNAPLQDLTNRTAWLKQRLENGGLGGDAFAFTGNLDTLRVSGFYLVRAASTNKPETGDGMALIVGITSNPDGGNTQSVLQLFCGNDSVVKRIFYRVITNGAVGSWASLYTTAEGAALESMFVGSVSAFATSLPPSGWLECAGQAVSRTTYANLFARIGTNWGAGNGSTTFNVPDLRGEFVRGYDHGRGVDTGRALFSAQGDEFKSHTHSEETPDLEVRTMQSGTGQSADRKTATFIQPSGATGGIETRPRNVAMLYCIKF